MLLKLYVPFKELNIPNMDTSVLSFEENSQP